MADLDTDIESRKIQSVEIAFEIINVLQGDGPNGVSSIARQLEHSKSTVYSHLQTLQDIEFVVQEDDAYRLSLRVLEMAEDLRSQFENLDVIQNEVDDLAQKTGEIVHFGIEEHNQVSYLYKSTGENAVETRSRVGTRQPMYSTGMGKAILAALPETRRLKLIDNIEFEERTPDTITDREELIQEISEISEKGYAVDREENTAGACCVSASVLDQEEVLGAVSISGPASRFTDEQIEKELSNMVQKTANVIELNLRFSD